MNEIGKFFHKAGKEMTVGLEKAKTQLGTSDAVHDETLDQYKAEYDKAKKDIAGFLKTLDHFVTAIKESRNQEVELYVYFSAHVTTITKPDEANHTKTNEMADSLKTHDSVVKLQDITHSYKDVDEFIGKAERNLILRSKAENDLSIHEKTGQVDQLDQDREEIAKRNQKFKTAMENTRVQLLKVQDQFKSSLESMAPFFETTMKSLPPVL